MDPQIILFLFNGLLAVAAFFGGMVIRDLSTAVSDLRKADEKLSEKLADRVTKDEFRELRLEQRELFEKLFDKLDTVRSEVARKADRAEVGK